MVSKDRGNTMRPIQYIYGQERYYDYSPNKGEKGINEYISVCKKQKNSEANYVPRIALAIQFAADTLKSLSDSIWDNVFEQVGGLHKEIDLGTNRDFSIDSTILQEIANFIPDMGSFSIKIINPDQTRYLVIYYSDIYYKKDPGGWIAAGGPDMEGIPDQHGFGCKGIIHSDSLKLIRYRGQFMLNIHPDSILDVQVIPCQENKYEISYTFEKGNEDIVSVNIYAFSRSRNKYELIEIFCPSNIGHGATKIYKSGE